MSDQLNKSDTQSLPKLKFLWRLTAMLIIGGLVLLFLPFVLSLSPTKHDIETDRMILPIDVTSMEVNKLYKFKNLLTSIDAKSIFVVRRTNEQVEYLLNNVNIKSIDERWEKEDPASTQNPLRSIKSDFFVFAVYESDGLIKPSRIYSDWVPQENVQVFSGKVIVYDDFEMLGGIYFPAQSDDRVARTYFKYDLAGRAVHNNIEPLMIPPYFYNYAGKIVIGHQSEQSVTKVVKPSDS